MGLKLFFSDKRKEASYGKGQMLMQLMHSVKKILKVRPIDFVKHTRINSWTLIAIISAATLIASSCCRKIPDIKTGTYDFTPDRDDWDSYFIEGSDGCIYYINACQIVRLYGIIFSRIWVIHKDYKITLMSDRLYRSYFDFRKAVLSGELKLDMQMIKNKYPEDFDGHWFYNRRFKIDEEMKKFYMRYGANGIIEKYAKPDVSNGYNLEIVEASARNTAAYYLWQNGYTYTEYSYASAFTVDKSNADWRKKENYDPMFPDIFWFFLFGE